MDELDQMDQEIEQLAAMQRANPRSSPPLPAEFDIEARLDPDSKPGDPKFRDVEIIRVRYGVKDTKTHEVTDEHRRMYAAQYVAWKKSNHVDQTTDGFPLAQWAMIPGKALVKELAQYGVKTVQQLAALKDGDIQRMGPFTAIRQHARDWVEAQKTTAPIAALREENSALAARVTALEGLLAGAQQEIQKARANGGVIAAPVGPDPAVVALQAQVAALVASMQAKPAEPTNGAPKRRGRPPKTPEPPVEG